MGIDSIVNHLVWTRTVDFYGPNKKAALEAHWAFWSFGDDVTLYVSV